MPDEKQMVEMYKAFLDEFTALYRKWLEDEMLLFGTSREPHPEGTYVPYRPGRMLEMMQDLRGFGVGEVLMRLQRECPVCGVPFEWVTDLKTAIRCEHGVVRDGIYKGVYTILFYPNNQ